MTFLWIHGLLLISLIGAQELSDFPENFVVAKRKNPITLTCNTSTLGPVEWRSEDDSLSADELFQMDGQDLILSTVDTNMLGEYSCWRGKEKLYSTYLLMEAEEEQVKKVSLKCRAKSYTCNFTCTWTDDRYESVRLGLGQECTTGLKSCDWVSSSHRAEKQGLQFVMSHSVSPYAEEGAMLKVTAEAIDDLHFLRITKPFYLRDIVVPDSPHIVTCHELEHNLNVSIEPPSSWSTPHSFFKLEHEIEYVLRDDGRTERAQSNLVPKKVSKLRVRSRDPLVLSQWSQWTPWKNVKRGKGNVCQCKWKKSRSIRGGVLKSSHHCKKTGRRRKAAE